MTPELIVLTLSVAVILASLAAILAIYRRSFVLVEQGHALIVNKPGRVRVFFTSALVIPIVQKGELIDIRVKTVELVRKGKEGLICKDNIRADVEVRFFVRVNKTADDVIKVAQSVGAVRAAETDTLQELFAAKFAEALKTVAKQLDFADLYTRRDDFKDQVIDVIGRDLNGYCLDDVSVDYIEQTPVEMLDPENILDAAGIQKITELTSKARLETARIKSETDEELARLELECKELLIRLEEQQANALAKLRASTGTDLSPQKLEERLSDRLREMVDKVLAERGK